MHFCAFPLSSWCTECSQTPRRAGLQGFGEAFGLAFGLVARMDTALAENVLLSLRVSLAAVTLACLVGMPLGALLAVARFPGRGAAIVVVNASMGLPPVVVGLVVYL